jgi:hypothetical protein
VSDIYTGISPLYSYYALSAIDYAKSLVVLNTGVV